MYLRSMAMIFECISFSGGACMFPWVNGAFAQSGVQLSSLGLETRLEGSCVETGARLCSEYVLKDTSLPAYGGCRERAVSVEARTLRSFHWLSRHRYWPGVHLFTSSV